MNYRSLNDVKTFGFSDRESLIKLAGDQKKALIAVNAEKILHANDLTRSLINRNIGYSDGMGAVWALKKKGLKDVIKIPGCELWLDVVKYYYYEKSFYLIGGKQEVIIQTIDQVKKQFHGINIVGFRNGYLQSEKEREDLIKDVAAKKPDIVFVAMGSPKQELLIRDMQKIHSAVYQGLGGSFDVYTENVKRAPHWYVKNNLEWAYRLVKQPIRIFRQWHLVKFTWKLILGKL
ncbi:WecB/TagA/CpsF family glycosyltransferase [Marinifilum sp. D737]|uniref:WecB/TagA/CpsF family glycosyltransferase n=1 Tax=Marinifilum sp. D737 TaxID=2969628 RepID=UPI002274E392|nr:WecB/TagA/CpsF family glycosyltransferase [Marinifilum sp. D737]MCY1635015.1 WecB/TagA/CpsF family glycosyltransferase [Marinifilum sp. D737]